MEKGLILLIDDDKEILDVLGEVLEDQGFKFLPFEDPLVAIEVILKTADIDVIVTDFRMPGMNGLGLLEKLNEVKNRVPVIMFTGVADKDLAVKALNIGCHNLMEKPLRQRELIHYIEQAMAFRRRESIAERLMQECTDLIGILQEQAQVYETRFMQAENFVYQHKTGMSMKPDDIQNYLQNISIGTSIESKVKDAHKRVEVLSKELEALKTVFPRGKVFSTDAL